jgi:hypothetical protein
MKDINLYSKGSLVDYIELKLSFILSNKEMILFTVDSDYNFKIGDIVNIDNQYYFKVYNVVLIIENNMKRLKVYAFNEKLYKIKLLTVSETKNYSSPNIKSIIKDMIKENTNSIPLNYKNLIVEAGKSFYKDYVKEFLEDNALCYFSQNKKLIFREIDKGSFSGVIDNYLHYERVNNFRDTNIAFYNEDFESMSYSYSSDSDFSLNFKASKFQIRDFEKFKRDFERYNKLVNDTIIVKVRNIENIDINLGDIYQIEGENALLYDIFLSVEFDKFEYILKLYPIDNH